MKVLVLFAGSALLGLPAIALAAAGHTVTLAWTDDLNPAGTTYTVYRSDGKCGTTPVFIAIKTSLTLKTYDDVGVSPGWECYTVTANLNSVESDQATPVEAKVKPFAPLNPAVAVR